MTKVRTGLALIVVVGILGVLAVLALAFVAMAQMERRASEQRLNGARAYLLARSGIEDALARLELGQDPAYGGENWDGSADGLLSAFEAEQEVHHRTGVGTPADGAGCPVRHAMRPSFFARAAGASPDPALIKADGRQRGYSGLLAGDDALRGNTYVLLAQPSNAGIHVNGGALDAEDRDPDGPGATAADFPLNPGAAAEVAPLLPNGVPDHRDISMEGPNGFLVRLLDNLDAVVTDGVSSRLGEAVVGARPAGGYRSLGALEGVLGSARYERFKPYLTTVAWVDPKVAKPQPMDGRASRWEDIDDTHRVGTPAAEIAGVKTAGGGDLRLEPLRGGEGIGERPWTQDIAATNAYEGAVTYPVSWERNFVYAWHQLRPSPPVPEPRAPVSVNAAPAEVLAAACLGLKGTYLEVWDGAAGWDGGFSWYGGSPRYDYPHPATEETPWIRTRVDYGMTYGTPERPWYGPRAYDPHAAPQGGGGKPVIQAAPLGRLKQTWPLSPPQATALAAQARRRIGEAGPFRTWAQFDAFVAALPRWEDADGDGVLDGAPYEVDGSGGKYSRRVHRREDLDGDGRMARETFAVAGGDWQSGILWKDASMDPSGVPGLSPQQKDVLRAMANPNADLNDFNPDANLWKEVDKLDLAGIRAEPGSYAHTTELALGTETGWGAVRALGRIVGPGGRLLARRGLGALLKAGTALHRDTTQADFMQAYADGAPLALVFAGPAPGLGLPYALAGGQPLLSYPEPQTVSGGARAAGAGYDGQIGLGFLGAASGPDETVRGDLFDTADATGALPPDSAAGDLRGPLQAPLLDPAGGGNVFPDGIYSEKDRALRYAMDGNFVDQPVSFDHPDLPVSWDPFDMLDHRYTFYIGCWVKPAWFPEASPRAHALVSLSRGAQRPAGWDPWDIPAGRVPVEDIEAHPVGLYFVPARNNASEDVMRPYAHNTSSTLGGVWPRRALLWGTTHSLFASDCLNRRGIAAASGPAGRLEGRRWQHLAMIGQVGTADNEARGSRLIIGKAPAAADYGGGWNYAFGVENRAIGSFHVDGTANHLRFGEVAAEHSMNYVADATFAGVRAGGRQWTTTGNIQSDDMAGRDPLPAYEGFFTDAASPAVRGRYLKEHGAAYAAPALPGGLRPARITWTEIPCDLWFDRMGPDGVPDGWLDSLENDRFTPAASLLGTSLPVPNGLRDVRIELEVWDDRGTPLLPLDDVKLGTFRDPAAENLIPPSSPLLPGILSSRCTYKAVFVNEWDAATRANFPLDVTPFLDDVTLSYVTEGGPQFLAYEADSQE